jgi:hypothetical protein
MLEKIPASPVVRPPSKDSILKEANGLRDLARRARRLAESVNEGDRRRLNRYVEELDESARRLEKAAIEARVG